METIKSYFGGTDIKAWNEGVPFEYGVYEQLQRLTSLPFVTNVAAMPDSHIGIGSTIGSVIATKGAILPACVGTDIGCGMMAYQTSLTASDLPDDLTALRTSIEAKVPHGGPGPSGGWQKGVPNSVMNRWNALEPQFKQLVGKYKAFDDAAYLTQLGTLGGGNHFVEICLDEADKVWVMLHSGSRGVGNLIGRTYIERAREMLIRRHGGSFVPDKDLAWFEVGEPEFDDYFEALLWAQDYAWENRKEMMANTLRVMHATLPPFNLTKEAVNNHHNAVWKETHFGEQVFVTRKGATPAGKDVYGIIPGSMGAKSYIVKGKGNLDSLCSCSHGAGRQLSRGAAKAKYTLDDLIEQTKGVNCRIDKAVIDEIPGAYKNIEAVMAAQADLVSIEHTLKAVLCIKG